MKVTALEEYGLRCMLLLGKSGPEAPLTLPEFKAKEGLSIPYAAKLLMILKRAGLVRAVRGRKGGYVLARRPEEIALKDIFNALGEPAFSSHYCDEHTGLYSICVHQSDCRVRDIWKGFDSFIGRILERITLADAICGKLDVLDAINASDANDRENGTAVSAI